MLNKYNVVYRGHPAFETDQETSIESFKKASIVISDYSSIGLEAIVLNIPTILFGHPKWRYKYNHISANADEATIRVYNNEDLEKAIETYLKDPSYLEGERLKHSKILCEYQGTSSKRFVDILEEIWKKQYM